MRTAERVHCTCASRLRNRTEPKMSDYSFRYVGIYVNNKAIELKNKAIEFKRGSSYSQKSIALFFRDRTSKTVLSPSVDTRL